MLRVLTTTTAATLLALSAAHAANVRKAVVAADAQQDSCVAPPSAASFTTSQRQAVLWFSADHVRRGDEIRVDWIDPHGSISLSAPWRDLPTESAVCLVTQMPIAGFEGAANPGAWTIRIYANQRLVATRGFRIVADPNYGAFTVTSVQRRATSNGFDLQIGGSGFIQGSTVNLATYSRTGGWSYITAAEPVSIAPTQIVAQHTPLGAGEYWVIVQTPDKILSRHIPFVVTAATAYRLPFPAGQRWVITQGPYGTFSHWGNSVHAWDIAPVSGRCVVAMRAGTVHTHDIGAVQSHSRRTFGNYITIDHGDGEFSHYAHLASGTFLVRDGEHVEQGQPLAVVGNSGYTLGEGGGYHVHVSVTHALPIASSSVPFQFEELSDDRFRGAVVSLNSSEWKDCSRITPPLQPAPVQMASTVIAPAPAPSIAAPKPVSNTTISAVSPAPAVSVPTREPQFRGQVAIEQWWNQLIVVARGTRFLEATLQWNDADAGLDLHLVSPRGEHYGWYANTTGYSGSFTRPQEFRIPNPEPGTWRISVEGVRGGGQAIDFGVDTNARRYPGAASSSTRLTDQPGS
jgi:murein DD-endopeptidase MepM/ murein hydrolase activator NlpD